MPLHVFVVELRDLQPGSPDLAGVARPVAWRFVVSSKGEPVAIDVGEHELDVQIERGPVVRRMAEMLKGAECRAEALEGALAPSVLRIPEAHLTAVWLRSGDPEADRVVPLYPAPQGLEAGREYLTTEFLRMASEIAERKQASYRREDTDTGELGA